MGTRADAIDDNTLAQGAIFIPVFVFPFAIWRARQASGNTYLCTALVLHLKIPSLDFQSASPAWACPSNLQAAKHEGAAGALERIVLPLKIFVSDGNGLKILFVDQLLSQPITHRSSLADLT